jgi:hypothetical protein
MRQMEGRWFDSENLRPAWFEFEGDCLLAGRADTGRNAREHSLRRTMNMSRRDNEHTRVSAKYCGKRVAVSEPHGVCVRNPRVERRVIEERGSCSRRTKCFVKPTRRGHDEFAVCRASNS